MEEVKTYWQVANIEHFCHLFRRPFKLPNFENEEIEHAFTTSIPDYTELEEERDDDEDDKNEETKQEPQELHLLVKLAIALLKPHFNVKLTERNWDTYLKRLIEKNWENLEFVKSPYKIPILSEDGVELTKTISFNELPLKHKIEIYHSLCDYRLWCDDASDSLRDYSIEELRPESIGIDSQGYTYWYFFGTRLYREHRERADEILCKDETTASLKIRLLVLEKKRIAREKAEKLRAEQLRARQLAAEEREHRLLAAKRLREEQQIERLERRAKDAEQEAELRKGCRTNARSISTENLSNPPTPLRAGLRQRRSSSIASTNKKEESESREVENDREGKNLSDNAFKGINCLDEDESPTLAASRTRRTQKSSKVGQSLSVRSKTNNIPHVQKEKDEKNPEDSCHEELERNSVSISDRAQAWSIACESLDEWEEFGVKISKSKSACDKKLSLYLSEELLPAIRNIYQKRVAEERKREKDMLLSLASRRVSTRIISRKSQEEEEERLARIREKEELQKAHAEQRLRIEIEQERRLRKHRLLFADPIMTQNETRSSDESDAAARSRYNLRPYFDNVPMDDIISPDKLSQFYDALEHVMTAVKSRKNAWPFKEPVPENVPGYYDVIKDPIDLSIISERVKLRRYKSLLELEHDFKLLVNNCETFNGPSAVYTKMAHQIWCSFAKNVGKHVEQKMKLTERDAFIYPPEDAEPSSYQLGVSNDPDKTICDRLDKNHDNSIQDSHSDPSQNLNGQSGTPHVTDLQLHDSNFQKDTTDLHPIGSDTATARTAANVHAPNSTNDSSSVNNIVDGSNDSKIATKSTSLDGQECKINVVNISNVNHSETAKYRTQNFNYEQGATNVEEDITTKEEAELERIKVDTSVHDIDSSIGQNKLKIVESSDRRSFEQNEKPECHDKSDEAELLNSANKKQRLEVYTMDGEHKKMEIEVHAESTYVSTDKDVESTSFDLITSTAHSTNSVGTECKSCTINGERRLSDKQQPENFEIRSENGVSKSEVVEFINQDCHDKDAEIERKSKDCFKDKDMENLIDKSAHNVQSTNGQVVQPQQELQQNGNKN